MASSAKPVSATKDFTFQIDGLTAVQWKRGDGISFHFESADKTKAFPAKIKDCAFIIATFSKAEIRDERTYTLLLTHTERVGLEQFDIDEIMLLVATTHTKDGGAATLTIQFPLSEFYHK